MRRDRVPSQLNTALSLQRETCRSAAGRSAARGGSVFCTRSTKPRCRQWKSRGRKISAVQRRMLCGGFLLQDTQPSAMDGSRRTGASRACGKVQGSLQCSRTAKADASASRAPVECLAANPRAAASVLQKERSEHMQRLPAAAQSRCRVICRGNARKFKLSSLGTVLGLRQDPWLSGTCRAFALMLMGNSHTGLNYRVPLRSTHDPDCARDCLGAQTVRRLQRAVARAARRATKYFTNFTGHLQPLGWKELQHAARHLSFLDTKPCQGKELQRHRQVVSRVLGDLEFRCSVRPVTGRVHAGWLLGCKPSSAEGIRSFCVATFVGHERLTQLDAVTEQRKKLKPHSKGNADARSAACSASELARHCWTMLRTARALRLEYWKPPPSLGWRTVRPPKSCPLRRNASPFGPAL